MTIDIFRLSWLIIFIVVMLIALIANAIIILAILCDKSMHTSTYFYIINVNIADIILVLSCLPERLADTLISTNGFPLGMFPCYLLPFLQQVSMHGALGSLLILTVHRCYPAGVPRFLQGDLIRRQIRSYPRTLAFIWVFAIVINVPLFIITKYEEHIDILNISMSENRILLQNSSHYSCETAATEIWSRTYLILLLALTYLITGIFLIVIYGQVIRIILASKKYAKKNKKLVQHHHGEQFRFLPSNEADRRPFRSHLTARGGDGKEFIVNILAPSSSSSSSSSAAAVKTNRRTQPNTNQTPISTSLPMIICTPPTPNNLVKSSTQSHSNQHLQVIIMLFIVIILYILLLLPYRLLNLLFIVHNQLFQQNFMNEFLFEFLLNSVRLLVFLNCALQPIIYLIISSRLRQTVLKLIHSWYVCHCRCHCSLLSSSPSSPIETRPQHFKTDTRAIHAYLFQKYPSKMSYPINQQFHRDKRPIQTSINNIHMIGCQTLPLPMHRSLNRV